MLLPQYSNFLRIIKEGVDSGLPLVVSSLNKMHRDKDRPFSGVTIITAEVEGRSVPES